MSKRNKATDVRSSVALLYMNVTLYSNNVTLIIHHSFRNFNTYFKKIEFF